MSCLGEYRNKALACRDEIRKAKAQLDLDLVKCNKQGFYKYIGNERKTRENVRPWLSGAWKRLRYSIAFLLQFFLYRFVLRPPRSLILVVETGRVIPDLQESHLELGTTEVNRANTRLWNHMGCIQVC